MVLVTVTTMRWVITREVRLRTTCRLKARTIVISMALVEVLTGIGSWCCTSLLSRRAATAANTCLQRLYVVDIFDAMLECASFYNDLTLVGIDDIIWKISLGKGKQFKSGWSKVLTDGDW